MSDYQPLHSYEHFNVSRYGMTLYSISSYESASSFHYSYTVIVHMTFKFLLTKCLLHVSWNKTERFYYHYSNYWNGHFCPQFWSV